jgi:protein TonB
MSETSIFSQVFAKREERSGRFWVASIVALMLHGALLFEVASLRVEPPSKEKQIKEYLVDVEPPKTPEPKPEPSPEPIKEATPEPVSKDPAPIEKSPKASPQPKAEPPPPAAAGKIVAAEPDPSAPVDFGDNTFITGDAKVFAGGTTTKDGTNDKAVHTKEVDPKSTQKTSITTAPPSAPSKARPVSLEESRWSCAWPKEADREQIDEQSVVLKVMVDVKGKVTSVSLVQDPGFGFGAAATACAYKTKFSPALDVKGDPVASLSPPIRVRFTR